MAKLGQILVSMGICTEQNIIEALALQQGYTYIDLKKERPTAEALDMLDKDIAIFYNCIPVSKHNAGLEVALADPLDITAIDALTQITGVLIFPRISNYNAIKEAWSIYYDKSTNNIHSAIDGLKKKFGDQTIRGNVDL